MMQKHVGFVDSYVKLFPIGNYVKYETSNVSKGIRWFYYRKQN